MGQKKPIVVSISEFKDICKMYLKNNSNFAIRVDGAPGIGKSEVIRQVINENLDFYVETRLAFKDNPELAGHQVPLKEERRAIYLRPDDIPNEPRTGWFLDEVNRVYHPSVFQTLFQIISNKTCGTHKLPENTFVFLAGNLGDEDETIITEFKDTALETRIAWFRLEPTFKGDWLPYAKNKIHSSITSFLEKNTEYWEQLKGRVWFQVNEAINFEDDFLDKFKKGSIAHKRLLEAIATPEAINEYFHFVKEFDEIDEKQILTNYEKVKEKIQKMDRERLFQLNQKILSHFEKVEADENIEYANKKEVINVLKYQENLDKDTASDFLSKILIVNKVILRYQKIREGKNPFTEAQEKRIRELFV